MSRLFGRVMMAVLAIGTMQAQDVDVPLAPTDSIDFADVREADSVVQEKVQSRGGDYWKQQLRKGNSI